MAKPGLELGGLTVLAWKGTLDPAAYGKELAQPGEFGQATTSSGGGGTTRNSGGLKFIFSLMNASESVLSLIPFLERWKL